MGKLKTTLFLTQIPSKDLFPPGKVGEGEKSSNWVSWFYMIIWLISPTDQFYHKEWPHRYQNSHQPQDIFAEVDLFPIHSSSKSLRYYFAVRVFPKSRQRQEFRDSPRKKTKITITSSSVQNYHYKLLPQIY